MQGIIITIHIKAQEIWWEVTWTGGMACVPYSPDSSIGVQYHCVNLGRAFKQRALFIIMTDKATLECVWLFTLSHLSVYLCVFTER